MLLYKYWIRETIKIPSQGVFSVFFGKVGGKMKKFSVKAKFNSKGKIVCISQTECRSSKDRKNCEEIDFL